MCEAAEERSLPISLRVTGGSSHPDTAARSSDGGEEDDDEDEDEDEDDVEECVRKLIKKRSMMCGTFICKFTPSLWLSSDIRLSFLKDSR